MERTNVLYNWQKELLSVAPKKVLFSMDTGTGKTPVSLYHYLKWNKTKPLIIYTPPAKIKEGGWLVWLEKLKIKKFEIRSIANQNAMPTKKEGLDCAFIIDEAHMIKSSKSKRGKHFTQVLRMCQNSVSLLTATPSNDWVNTINYFAIMNCDDVIEGVRAFRYKEKFIKMRNYYNVPIAFNDEEYLEDRAMSFTVHASKEMLCLKSLIVNDIVVEPTIDEQKIIKDCVDGDKILDSKMSVMHHIRQNQGTINRLTEVDKILKKTKGNVVIFCEYIEHQKSLYSLCKAYGDVKMITGSKKELDYNKKSNRTIFIIHYKSGGAGIELAMCNKIIYFTPTYSYQDYMQSIGRCYRAGQKDEVILYRLKSGLLDNDIYLSLLNKKDFKENVWLTKGRYL